MVLYFPKSLFELAGNALNKLPEPVSWSWSVKNVMDWAQNVLKLPQYVPIFEGHKIDGKKLILINCRTLPAMRISDFEHIKYIAKNVRYLYGLPPDHNPCRGKPVRDVYGRYYTYLAEHFGRRPAVESLFDYAKLIGMISGPLRRASGHYDDSPHCRPEDATALIARLPHTEYLQGGPSLHADVVVRLFRSKSCDAPPLDEDDEKRRSSVITEQ